MDAVTVGTRLRDQLNKDLQNDGRIGMIRPWLRGTNDPYMPPGATGEFKRMAQQSRTPWLGLVTDTFAKALFVDGYSSSDGVVSPAWSYWQANGLDARQSIVYRAALNYGLGWVLVVAGDPVPVIRPLRAAAVAAEYDDPDDPWPMHALVQKSATSWRLYDGTGWWPLEDRGGVLEAAGEPVSHGGQVCPLVRFRPQLDDDAIGILAPLLPVAQRIDAITFATQIALHYGAFRQRWATGLVRRKKRVQNPETGEWEETGEQEDPFRASIDRVWASSSQDTKFGDFAQTDVRGHLEAYTAAVRTLGNLAQLPPHIFGDMVNLAAETLAATYDSTRRRVEEFQSLFGEQWEQALRLAAALDGDADGAADVSSQVRWRDPEARALAATVDALGKMRQMLDVPAQALWPMVPGVTDQDLGEWKRMAEDAATQAAQLQATAFGLGGLTADGQPA